jgi:hypothetical protein
MGLLVAAVGCGPRGVGATAAGLVTIDGQPAPAGIRVDFQPQGEKGSPSMGITDAQGKYELFFTAARKGVMPGECLVRITVMPQLSAEGIPTVPEALKAIRIPDHYGRQSMLMRTVKPGSNQIDIAIDTSPAKAK